MSNKVTRLASHFLYQFLMLILPLMMVGFIIFSIAFFYFNRYMNNQANQVDSLIIKEQMMCPELDELGE